MLALKIEVDGVTLIQKKLYRLRELNLSQPYQIIGQYLVSETQLRFLYGVNPEGQQWLPSQRVIKNSGQTLVNRGHLRQSISYHAARDYVEVGTNLIYAAIHQFGGRAGRGHRANIPRRSFLGVSTQDTLKIEKIITDYLQRQTMSTP